MIEGAYRPYEHDALIGTGRYQRVGRYPGFPCPHRSEPVGGTLGSDATSVIAGAIRDRAARVVVRSDREWQRRQVGAVLDAAGPPGGIGLRHGVEVNDEPARRVIADGCTLWHVDPDTPWPEPLSMPCRDSRCRRGPAQPHRMLALGPP